MIPFESSSQGSFISGSGSPPPPQHTSIIHVHLMLLHFPIALVPVAVVLEWIAVARFANLAARNSHSDVGRVIPSLTPP